MIRNPKHRLDRIKRFGYYEKIILVQVKTGKRKKKIYSPPFCSKQDVEQLRVNGRFQKITVAQPIALSSPILSHQWSRIGLGRSWILNECNHELSFIPSSLVPSTAFDVHDFPISNNAKLDFVAQLTNYQIRYHC